MTLTRRTALAAGAVAAAGSAVEVFAAETGVPRAISRHPGYRGWSPPEANRGPVPLDLELSFLGGQRRTLRQWLGGKSAVLVLWATWCPPCLAEKPRQAALEARLKMAGAPSRIKGLQAYDDAGLLSGVRFARRLGAGNLDLARAGAPMEKAFLDVFGRSSVDPSRTALPSMLLLSKTGVELGRAMGTMGGLFGGSYWERKSTLEFLSALDDLA